MSSHTLEQFRTTKSSMVLLALVGTHPAFQPRDGRLVPFKDVARVEQRSRDQCAMLREALDCSKSVQLEPIWLADVPPLPQRDFDGGLYVVDGHHRLSAYRHAGRESIPARVLPMDFATTVLLSKQVNCTGRSLEMHREQRLDAVWHYLIATTGQGTTPLPKGESTRTVALRYGVGHATVGRMLAVLKDIDLAEFPIVTHDPGTGWPRWRYIRQSKNPWQTRIEQLPDSESIERESELLARTIMDLMSKSSHEVMIRALEKLANEEVDVPDPVAAVNFLGNAVRPQGIFVEHVLSHWDRKPSPTAQPPSQKGCPIETVSGVVL